MTAAQNAAGIWIMAKMTAILMQPSFLLCQDGTGGADELYSEYYSGL